MKPVAPDPDVLMIPLSIFTLPSLGSKGISTALTWVLFTALQWRSSSNSLSWCVQQTSSLYMILIYIKLHASGSM